MIKLWNYRHISVWNMVGNSIQSFFFLLIGAQYISSLLEQSIPHFLLSDAG